MQTLHDLMDPARAAALHQILGREGAPPGPGDPLPPFFQQIYFWQALRPDGLGRDGHARTGEGLVPDLGLPQRMWAAGEVIFQDGLRLGSPAEKTSVVEEVTEKEGRSGRLGFVTIRHEFRQDGALALTERQNLVFREPPDRRATAPAPPGARRDEAYAEARSFPVTLLFRYSALTYNGHRIHYDIDYCRDVEGYSGLVVHGPLLAQSLLHLAWQRQGPLKRFRFRATSALMHHETAELCADDAGTLWVRAADGRQCMMAWAE